MNRQAIKRRTFARIPGYFAAFAVAMVLMVISLPETVLVFRPDFVALLLIYLCWNHSENIGIFSAFVVGLMVDVLTFGVLGQHALAKVVVAYLAIRFKPGSSRVKAHRQAFVVFALLCAQALVISLTMLYANDGGSSLALWIVPLSSAMLWFAFALVGLIIMQKKDAAI